VASNEIRSLKDCPFADPGAAHGGCHLPAAESPIPDRLSDRAIDETRAADELGFHDEGPSADAKHYTPTELGDDAEHSPGKVEPTVLRTLDAAIACVSLVIQSTITDRPMKRCRI
jgi:hypothetical protein